MTSPPPTPRRPGRPRRLGGPAGGDVTEEILVAAGRLFGVLGVEGTTMARLAAEVGLGQSSLYYYFRNRDDVVAALVSQANVVPLEVVAAIAAAPASAPAKLHAFIRGDVEALCALAFDINEIHRIAARDRERFEGYWRGRAKLERTLSAIVAAGVAAGELRAVEPRLTALHLLAADEGTQNWFRLRPSARPSKVAGSLADLVVAGLLAPGGDLAVVQAEAANLSRTLRNRHTSFSSRKRP